MTGWVRQAFYEPQGMLCHGAALLYAIGGYSLGWLGLFHAAWWVNVLSVPLLGTAMTVAAYLIHECGHNTVFRSNRANAAMGRFLSWICGSSYSTFEDIRYAHFRHHMDNDDVVWFMYDDFFDRHPNMVRIIKVLEWAFIPAHEFLMHGIGMFSAFIIPQRRDQRLRQVLVIAIRLGIFITIAIYAPLAALGYVIAYMLMMHVLRFMDAQQHDYGSYPSLYNEDMPSRFGGRKTELAHTFSNPLSWNNSWVNWLTLNFGWHSAHHARPTVPWYRLRDYYLEHISDNPASVIPFRAQWHMYWKYRVCRVTHTGGPHDDIQDVTGQSFLEAGRQGELYGGNAASFLTPF